MSGQSEGVRALGVRAPELRGRSWVLRSRVRRTLSKVISTVALHITLLLATHEPPSRLTNTATLLIFTSLLI